MLQIYRSQQAAIIQGSTTFRFICRPPTVYGKLLYCYHPKFMISYLRIFTIFVEMDNIEFARCKESNVEGEECQELVKITALADHMKDLHNISGYLKTCKTSN